MVIALIVEPRLLRHFGERISNQTFWASFYSKAPAAYREAIKKLAGQDQFATGSHWVLTFDWAEASRDALRLHVRSEVHHLNNSSE
ncbi:MAG TPA: hypothetical protein VK390_05205, partial [Propionibacteriaceae bacterium]|nr:hypothetical protein [Propionibacteriaceae bacterium]